MKYFVGVDIGGTRLKAGLVDETHRVYRQSVVWLSDEDKAEEPLLESIPLPDDLADLPRGELARGFLQRAEGREDEGLEALVALECGVAELRRLVLRDDALTGRGETGNTVTDITTGLILRCGKSIRGVFVKQTPPK